MTAAITRIRCPRLELELHGSGLIPSLRGTEAYVYVLIKNILEEVRDDPFHMLVKDGLHTEPVCPISDKTYSHLYNMSWNRASAPCNSKTETPEDLLAMTIQFGWGAERWYLQPFIERNHFPALVTLLREGGYGDFNGHSDWNIFSHFLLSVEPVEDKDLYKSQVPKSLYAVSPSIFYEQAFGLLEPVPTAVYDIMEPQLKWVARQLGLKPGDLRLAGISPELESMHVHDRFTGMEKTIHFQVDKDQVRGKLDIGSIGGSWITLSLSAGWDILRYRDSDEWGDFGEVITSNGIGEGFMGRYGRDEAPQGYCRPYERATVLTVLVSYGRDYEQNRAIVKAIQAKDKDNMAQAHEDARLGKHLTSLVEHFSAGIKSYKKQVLTRILKGEKEWANMSPWMAEAFLYAPTPDHILRYRQVVEKIKGSTIESRIKKSCGCGSGEHALPLLTEVVLGAWARYKANYLSQ